MKITRNDILAIAKKQYELASQKETDNIDYALWVEFIEKHKDYFVWYEDTPEGKNALKSIDKVPDWAKERVQYSLNKKKAYSTEIIAKKPSDLVVSYSDSDKRISISIEKNVDKRIANILLKMAKYLDALLLKDGTEIIDESTITKLPE